MKRYATVQTEALHTRAGSPLLAHHARLQRRGDIEGVGRGREGGYGPATPTQALTSMVKRLVDTDARRATLPSFCT
jgi:hypothetical protein